MKKGPYPQLGTPVDLKGLVCLMMVLVWSSRTEQLREQAPEGGSRNCVAESQSSPRQDRAGVSGLRDDKKQGKLES